MTLIKSISGIRGTIGGKVGENLTPIDVVFFASAYAAWLWERNPNEKTLQVVIGRDARPSGHMIQQLVMQTLIGCGIDIIDLDLSTTPTVEMAVIHEKAHGGIIITASHNPEQWNALKLLNEKGEFISAEDGSRILELTQHSNLLCSQIDKLGRYRVNSHAMQQHIEAILDLPWIQKDLIKAAGFKVILDAVNSTGGLAVPLLLEKLGVETIKLYCEPTGKFPHNPEPLEAHLSDIMRQVPSSGAHLGIVVDPDVDRLALICEDGTMFGEEYTLVACADYVLSKKGGNTVSNLSSSRALCDVTNSYGGVYFASAVGEVNVVRKMKDVQAIIGGEGNGGVIFPELHYGRDALLGIALFLSLLAERDIKASRLRASYPDYFMAKEKIDLAPDLNVDAILEKLAQKFQGEKVNKEDGVKVDFSQGWVHLRKSNTEPIIRIYSEAKTQQEAYTLVDMIKSFIHTI